MRRSLLAASAAAVLAVTVVACGRAAGESEGVHGPSEALAFVSATLDSKPFEGRSLAGQPAVLWFWEPSCVACRTQAPEVAMTADLYEGRVNVLGVAGGGGEALRRDFAELTGTRGLLHLSDPGKEVWGRFGVSTPGVYVLLDRGGDVVVRGAGLEGRLAKEVAALVR
ncbi:redoxin domain-containing protein [Streptomyces sp. R302]|nr:redoxin domain-containing protein [Streptomyces sp. R301]NML80815.1 redoxin domain-containing protein [Streptomyces sp. R302]